MLPHGRQPVLHGHVAPLLTLLLDPRPLPGGLPADAG